MTTALAQFKVVEEAGDGGDYSSITDTYLEPLRLNLSPPDYSRLEKPPKPPVPEVRDVMRVPERGFIRGD